MLHICGFWRLITFALGSLNGACAHYVMVSKFQWQPFWLATQRDPQNDWTATQNRVNYDVFAQTPLCGQNEFVRSFSLLHILSLASTFVLFSPVNLI